MMFFIQAKAFNSCPFNIHFEHRWRQALEAGYQAGFGGNSNIDAWPDVVFSSELVVSPFAAYEIGMAPS